MSILKLDIVMVPLFVLISYLLVPKIEICLKYRQKIPKTAIVNSTWQISTVGNTSKKKDFLLWHHCCTTNSIKLRCFMYLYICPPFGNSSLWATRQIELAIIRACYVENIPVASNYPYLPRQSRWSTLRIVKCKSCVGFNIF